MLNWNLFAYVNLICALAATALWYFFPQLMAWPLLLGIVPWLLRVMHEGRWPWRTPYDWPLFLFLLSGLISVWAAYDREMAWAKFWIIVSAVLLFYALAAFSLPGAPDDPRRGGILTAWFLAFFGAGMSFYFLATHNWDTFPTKFAALSAIGRGLQGILPELPGHRLHPNIAGGILAMAIPFAVAVSWQAKRARNWPALVMGLALVGGIFLGLILSASRGAWIAVLAAILLAILWKFVGVLGGNRPGRQRLLFTVTLMLGAAILMIALLIRPEIPLRLIDRLPLFLGGTNRLELFRGSLTLAQEYPLVGAGLGGYMMLYSTYIYMTHVGFIGHAHNLFLDVMIEQGSVALLVLLWMWSVFAIAVWRESFDGRIRPYLGAAALSLVTILIHGLVDDALYSSEAARLLFLPLAFALPYPRRNKDAVPRRQWIVQGLVLGLLVVIIMVWARPLQSAAVSNLASIRQSQAELSRYQWPDWPIQDALRRELDLSSSIIGYKKALGLNPFNAAANRRLGQIELSLGEYDNALKHLEMAYARTPEDNATRQLLGEALLVNKRTEEGAALWATINNSQNQLQTRAYWYKFIADDERLAQIEMGIEKK